MNSQETKTNNQVEEKLPVEQKVIGDNEKRAKKPFKERAAIWYDYNKQSIPFIFMIISTIFISAFLDIGPQPLDRNWYMSSHFQAMERLYTFFPTQLHLLLPAILFAMILIAIVMFFMSFSFSKKRSPAMLITLTSLGTTKVIFGLIYLFSFLTNMFDIPNLNGSPAIPASMYLSIVIVTISVLATIASVVFAWFYVDWKYVKYNE